MQDDPRQAELATKIVESLSPAEPGYVTLVSALELGWVLSSCFDLQRSQIADALDALLRTKEIVLQDAEVIWRAVKDFRSSSADLADCLIERSAAAAGCTATLTFDRKAAQSAGMKLITQRER